MQENPNRARYFKAMMRNLALLGALVLCVSCSSIKGGSGKTVYREGEPIATHVPDGDPEMKAAEAKARETMPEFMAELKKELAKPAGTSKLMFAIKSTFSADGQDEHMWSDVTKFENGIFHGNLANTPLYITSIKAGDPVQVAEDKVEDWAIFDENDNMRGGYTAKLLMEREEAKGK